MNHFVLSLVLLSVSSCAGKRIKPTTPLYDKDHCSWLLNQNGEYVNSRKTDDDKNGNENRITIKLKIKENDRNYEYGNVYSCDPSILAPTEPPRSNKRGRRFADLFGMDGGSFGSYGDQSTPGQERSNKGGKTRKNKNDRGRNKKNDRPSQYGGGSNFMDGVFGGMFSDQSTPGQERSNKAGSARKNKNDRGLNTKNDHPSQYGGDSNFMDGLFGGMFSDQSTAGQERSNKGGSARKNKKDRGLNTKNDRPSQYGGDSYFMDGGYGSYGTTGSGRSNERGSARKNPSDRGGNKKNDRRSQSGTALNSPFPTTEPTRPNKRGGAKKNKNARARPAYQDRDPQNYQYYDPDHMDSFGPGHCDSEARRMALCSGSVMTINILLAIVSGIVYSILV